MVQQKLILLSDTYHNILHSYLSDPKGTTPYLINLVDSPGHVDFSSEVCGSIGVLCV